MACLYVCSSSKGGGGGGGGRGSNYAIRPRGNQTSLTVLGLLASSASVYRYIVRQVIPELQCQSLNVYAMPGLDFHA